MITQEQIEYFAEYGYLRYGKVLGKGGGRSAARGSRQRDRG